MELQLDDGSRSSLGIGPGSDDAVEPHQEFTRRFAEGIGKLAGNTLGDRQKKTIGPVARMSEAARLGGTLDRPYPGNKAAASSYQRVNRPGQWVNRIYPVFLGKFDFWLQKSEATWGL
ncbi:hypothetical protein BHM03_00027823 [Ensete ventricosum]|nr:hypothetical protein BHM03_00027823 [Ensete ventricosum]